MSGEQLGALIFLALLVFMWFIDFFGSKSRAQEEVAERKMEALKKFSEIEEAPGQIHKHYKSMTYNTSGFWQDQEYSAFKNKVLSSCVVTYDQHGIPQHNALRLAYRIDNEKQVIYLNESSGGMDPELAPWDIKIDFETWSSKITEVDRAIENYREKRKLERQGKPDPKWWQFWLID